LHPDIKGTGLVRLLSFFAWFIAVIGPVVSIILLTDSLRIIIPQLISGAITTATGSVLERYIVDMDTFYGFVSLWNLLWSLARTVVSGFFTYIGGNILLFVGLIMLIIMLALLRKKVQACRIILIINACLCVGGGLLCYVFVGGVLNIFTNELSQVPSHMSRIAPITLGIIFVSAALWAAATFQYFAVAGKSDEMIANRVGGYYI